MPGFSCRFRVNIAPGCAVSSEELVVQLLETPEGQRIELAGVRDQALSKSHILALRAHGWTTSEAAEAAGKRLADIFLLSLVRSKVGVESWARRTGGGFFTPGLRMLEEQTGHRVLNDSIGLMVYETEPPPLFASVNAKAVIGVSAPAFIESFRALAAMDIALSERERIAIDLFNASFFEPAADTRLITLVMAIEALLERELRPESAVALVDELIVRVEASALPEADRFSLARAVADLRRESIRSAGRRLLQQRLGEAVYDGQTAGALWDRCFTVRNQLVHGGDIRQGRETAASTAGQLQRLVSDLLTGRFVAQAAQG